MATALESGNKACLAMSNDALLMRRLREGSRGVKPRAAPSHVDDKNFSNALSSKFMNEYAKIPSLSSYVKDSLVRAAEMVALFLCIDTNGSYLLSHSGCKNQEMMWLDKSGLRRHPVLRY